MQRPVGAQAVGERDRYWYGFLRSYLVLASLWLLWVFLDPIGLDSAMRRQTQEITAKVMSYFYGHGSRAFGQSQIAVVLITDSTLEDGETYPLPYARHHNYFSWIVAQQPAMVFVDLAFFGERFGDRLSDLTEPFERAGIPVLFAGGHPDESMPTELRDHRVVTAWEAPDGEYPLWQVDANKQRRPTAAMALYKKFCAKGWKCKNHGGDSDFRDNLVVQWGAHVAPEQDTIWNVSDCTSFKDGFFSRFGAALRSLGLSLFDGLDEALGLEPRQECFYPLTIRAEQLADLAELKATSPLHNRVVFYGASVSGIPDLRYSPVHGLVPGVFVHAMALDNLLTYGRKYYRDPGIKAKLLEAMVWMLMIVTPSHLRAKTEARRRHRTPGPATAGARWLRRIDHYPHVTMVVLAVLGIAFNEFARWEVKNWLGLAVLFELLHGALHPREAVAQHRAAGADAEVTARPKGEAVS